MRKIKFRVWDKVNKIIFYTDKSFVLFFRQGGEEPDFWALRQERMPIEICNNKNGILMQFTGLIDKNKNEIYEGDIVKGSYGFCIEPTIVEFNNIIYWKEECSVPEDIEVIGNIYENEELVKK